MVNDQRYISSTTLTTYCLFLRHPKFYRMLALFHRKYISPFYRLLQGREEKHSGKALTKLRSGNAIGEPACVEGRLVSGCVLFLCLFQAFATSAVSFGDSALGVSMIVTSFNTGALLWWKAVERYAWTGTPLISFLIGLCISFQFNQPGSVTLAA